MVQEAETAVLSGAFVVGDDPAASGGRYIYTPDGTGDLFEVAGNPHSAAFCFEVSTTGRYRIKGLELAPTTADNSFFVQVDGAPTLGYLWDTQRSTTYFLDYVNDRNTGADPLEIDLSAGQHNLVIYMREDGNRLDTLELELVSASAPTATPTSTTAAPTATATGAATATFTPLPPSSTPTPTATALPPSPTAAASATSTAPASATPTAPAASATPTAIATANATATFTPIPPSPTPTTSSGSVPCSGLVREAETATLTGAFVIGYDSKASSGAYIHVPNGTGDLYQVAGNPHTAAFCFGVTTPGIYRIEGWTYAATTADNSFFVQVNGSPAAGYYWDTKRNIRYAQDYVNDQHTVTDPVEIFLGAGQQTLVVYLREDGTRLDRLALKLVQQASPTATPTSPPPSATATASTVPASPTPTASPTAALPTATASLTALPPSATPPPTATPAASATATLTFTPGAPTATTAATATFTAVAPSPTPTAGTPACGSLVQEAENGTLSGAFVIGTDAAASGGAYIHVPDGTGDIYQIPGNPSQAQYCFTVTTSGVYRIRGWEYAATTADNSFFVQVDGSPAEGYLWDTLRNTTYAPDYVNDRNTAADPVEITLEAGQHTLVIYLREDGNRLDKLELELVQATGPLPTPAPGLCFDPIRIMPLGDSITRGSGSPSINGYRRPLYQGLVSQGYTVDMVGSQLHGTNDFDRNHEGHSGWSADGGATGSIAPNVYNFLVANPADIVLLHIGTNDITEGGASASEVAAILNEIDRYSTKVHVILALIINRATYSPETSAFNAELQAMADARIANGDRLIVVNMEPALDYSMDLADNLHPNDSGYAKMANVWLPAVVAVQQSCTVP